MAINKRAAYIAMLSAQAVLCTLCYIVGSPIARAEDIKIPDSKIMEYAEWISASNSCPYSVEVGNSEQVKKCAEFIVAKDQKKNLSKEQNFEYLMYKSISEEERDTKLFAIEYKNRIISDYKSVYGALNSLISYKPSGISIDSYGAFVKYFFSGSVTAVTVYPLFVKSIIYYNPYVDAAFVIKFKKESGRQYFDGGFFVFGETLRGEPIISTIPSWLQQTDPFLYIRGLIGSTISAKGTKNFYELHYASRIDIKDEQKKSIFYRRIGELASSIKNFDGCGERYMRLLNDSPLLFAKEFNNSNIEPSEISEKHSDYMPIASAIDGKKNVIYFVASQKAPNNIIRFNVSASQDGSKCEPISGEYDNILKKYIDNEESIVRNAK